RYAALAAGAARDIWESRGGFGPKVCCGLAGGALSFFCFGRLNGQGELVRRGRDLLSEAARSFFRSSESNDLGAGPPSFFRGEVGVELAAAESLEPELSIWPFCQSPL